MKNLRRLPFCISALFHYLHILLKIVGNLGNMGKTEKTLISLYPQNQWEIWEKWENADKRLPITAPQGQLWGRRESERRAFCRLPTNRGEAGKHASIVPAFPKQIDMAAGIC